jgi:hypothetical protein
MSGYYASQGVVWLNEPAPADRFSNDLWRTVTAEQAALLVPGQALTDAWTMDDDTFMLLPAPAPQAGPALIAGIVWKTYDLHETRVTDILDQFAACVLGAQAVIWGVGAAYDNGMSPCIFTYTHQGFVTEELPYQRQVVLFHPAQRRTATFTTPVYGPAPATAPAPNPLDAVPIEHRSLVLDEVIALLEARNSSEEAIGLVQRLKDARMCSKCRGRGSILLEPAEDPESTEDMVVAGVIRRCRACNRTGLVPTH